MVLLRKLKALILWPYIKIRDHIRYKRKLKKLKEQDPYIYK